MLSTFKKSVVRVVAVMLLSLSVLTVPATSASATYKPSEKSCHHGTRQLTQFTQEKFVRHYKSGTKHIHVVRYYRQVTGKSTYYTVHCGNYVGGTKLIHWNGK